MRKIAAVLLVFCLILSGCGMAAKDEAFSLGASGGNTKVNTSMAAGTKEEGSDGSTRGMMGDMPADVYDPKEVPVPGFEGTVAGVAEESRETEAAEAVDSMTEPKEEEIPAPELKEDERFGIAPYQRVVVQAFSEGMPAGKIKVRLCTASGSAIAYAVTDHNGKAYLYYNIYGGQESADHVVLVKPDGSEVRANLADVGLSETTGDGTIENQTEPDGMENSTDGQGQLSPYFKERITSAELTVELGALEAAVPLLDLMFVFDTTGSMGDELMYLQKEFEDIAGRVADQNTRFSVNFYRDHEDSYIVRANPFSSDIGATAAQINAESADGGGDYEEAVDEALINAVLEHDWREEAVKLMFLILDAPPHDTEETAANLRAALDAAMERGIRIIPIASSGVNEVTEAFLRSLAMLTGGTYTFLTDDSGIGNSHLEPTVGAYTVEALNEMIVRLIKEYYGK